MTVISGKEKLAQSPACQDMGGAAASGLFLHAGWRSCGTWMWERLRDHAEVRAFYEPLHEDLATLRAQDVALLRPDSWQSGHGTGAPYFAEYRARLRTRGGGVRDYHPRFAFDSYFLDADADDPGLEAYLRGLMESAVSEARAPVVKFCRSLGRVGWMERHFPDVAHAVILRSPEGQWHSARLQMERNKNRYFVLAPFVILARNASHPLLADAMERLSVRVPPLLGRDAGRDLRITTEACWRHVRGLGWRDRFRGFLALWAATGVAALDGRARLIDADGLADDPAHRRAAELAMGDAAGVEVDLMPDPQPGGGAADAAAGAAERQDAAQARAAAMGFLRAHAGRLDGDRLAVLAGKLAPMMEADAVGPMAAAHWPGAAAYADAAAYVAVERATYPLRRAHFHVRRWLGHL